MAETIASSSGSSSVAMSSSTMTDGIGSARQGDSADDLFAEDQTLPTTHHIANHDEFRVAQLLSRVGRWVQSAVLVQQGVNGNDLHPQQAFHVHCACLYKSFWVR